MPDAQTSTTVRAGSRTYFVDLKQTRAGKQFVVITESRFKGEGKDHERHRITVFPDNADAFLEAVTKMIRKI